MYSIDIIIISFFLQALLINRIDGNVIRHRRQQPSGSLYGNSNLGANTGFNYPTNFYGTNLNNQGSKDLYSNPMVPSNPGNSLNNMGLNNQQQQQQQQQQQLYGPSGQSLPNPAFSGTGFYSGSGTNPLLRDQNANMAMRDSNGNLIPAGSPGSSLYSSNPQMGYLPNANPGLTNKDMYNVPSNTNNNQYGLNSNLFPNSNTYSGQMGTNNNNNLWPNNQFQSNAGNTWSSNRNLNNNNNNAYSNPNSPYFYNNNGHRIMTSCLIMFFSFIIIISFFHI